MKSLNRFLKNNDSLFLSIYILVFTCVKNIFFNSRIKLVKNYLLLYISMVNTKSYQVINKYDCELIIVYI